jgi:hypothetical protein
MSGLGEYLIKKLTGRKAAPDLVTTPAAPDWHPIQFKPRVTTPAADDVEEGDGARAKRYAHGRIVVDGTLYLLRFDRETGGLRIRKIHARAGTDLQGVELARIAAKLMEGSLRL